jgi:hypothetical protein
MVSTLIYSYRLALLGLDPLCLHEKEPNAAEFVFFGDIGEQLTGASALTLSATGQGIKDDIPLEITRLYGRHYNLKVNVSRGSLQRERISYRVYSMTALLTPSTMSLREIEKNTTTPSASVETHDGSSSQRTRRTSIHENENGSLQHVDMGNTSEPASQAMDVAATANKNKQVSTTCKVFCFFCIRMKRHQYQLSCTHCHMLSCHSSNRYSAITIHWLTRIQYGTQHR